MQALGVNVPGKNLNSPVGIALTNLALLPARDGFAHLSYKGNFSVAEVFLQYTQNLRRGFFIQAQVPLRKLKISNVYYTDCSPRDDEFPNINTPAWQTFLNLYDTILATFGLNACGATSQGIGDISAYLGWSYSYEQTELLDYVDAEFKLGVFIPTGKQQNEGCVFSLPLGYDGHLGIPIQFNAAIGSFDWMTVGMHVGGIAFVDKVKSIRMKTDLAQSGFIKLAQACANVKKGNIWHAGGYFKADHFCRGFSFLVGYTFAQEQRDTILPCDTNLFSEAIAGCSDPMFQGWTMHTVNFIADYDFTTETCLVGPHVGLFYNLQVAGTRTFNTSVGGGQLGLDIAWQFD